MVPIDPAMGEFRVHYAGFFDPGFGAGANNRPSARAVLEVRSYEVPFFLEDGQVIGRLVYEKMAEAPQLLYGATAVSNYQGQGLSSRSILGGVTRDPKIVADLFGQDPAPGPVTERSPRAIVFGRDHRHARAGRIAWRKPRPNLNSYSKNET